MASLIYLTFKPELLRDMNTSSWTEYINEFEMKS